MRRVQRDVCHEELVKRLTSENGAVFSEIWRVLLFAAAVGIGRECSQPIQKSDSGKAIPESYFSTPGWKGFLYLIGVADDKSGECLRGDESSQERLITLFEEYANGGLHFLSDRMQSTSTQLDVLLTLLLEVTSSKTGPLVTDLSI